MDFKKTSHASYEETCVQRLRFEFHTRRRTWILLCHLRTSETVRYDGKNKSLCSKSINWVTMWLIGLDDNPVMMGLTIISNFKLALVVLHVGYTSGRKANGDLFSIEERTFWFCFMVLTSNT